ncbi:nth-like DNA glycosylase 1 [Leptinotarsa decemlineata]|uniref:nth-like DNA glycosylase 1 n=1 Tax=Leptinotarsa decemlineata TaxID=7539 RepID=UPI003D3075B5
MRSILVKVNYMMNRTTRQINTRSSANNDASVNRLVLSKFKKPDKPKMASYQNTEVNEGNSDGKSCINKNTNVQNIKQEAIDTEEINAVDSRGSSSSCSKRKHIKVEYEATSQVKSECTENSEIQIPLIDKKAPYNWETVLTNLREMRKNCDAPVDTMGCHKCHEEDALPNVMRYQILISLMLSSQTKDQVTHAAMEKLKNHGCTVENILKTSDEKLGELIYPVGFWKSKVKYIKRTTEILEKEYNSDIPDTVEKLCKLPGVGPKMAHICMNTAWGQVTGIGVDTHVHRISNRLGWVDTKTPEETRKALEGWLPYDLWSEVNHLLVGFGQQICQPVRPQCATCLNHEICPYGIKYINGELRGTKLKKEK